MSLRATAVVSIVAIVATATTVAGQKAPPVWQRPTPGPAKPFVFPKISTQTLPNGLRLAVLENHELPLVAVRAAFTGGTFLDPTGKEGAWSLLMTSLREGTTMRSSSQISDAIMDLGTAFAFPALGSSNAPGFTAAKSAWQPSLEILADMVTHPSLPSDGVQLGQTNLAAALGRLNPQQLAQRMFFANLYGSAHPGSRYATDVSVRNISRDDLIQLQTAYLRPQNAIIVVVGDVTPLEARAAVVTAFASWERGGTTIDRSIPVAAPQVSPTTIYLKDNPGLVQSVVMGGQLLPGRESLDGAATEALAAVLGAGNASAGSRVYTAFRKERGLAYSPSIILFPRPVPEPTPLLGQLTVAAGNTDTAVTEWIRVIRDAKGKRPVTQAELDFSRGNLVGILPAQMETIEALATRVIGILRDGLPETYLDDWARRMSTLTLQDVDAAANKYLDPDHLVIIVVGDRAKIEAPLRATGIPVVIIDR